MCVCVCVCVCAGSSQPTTGEQFGQWFTWCQSCRHGGHAQHITEWFRYVRDVKGIIRQRDGGRMCVLM